MELFLDHDPLDNAKKRRVLHHSGSGTFFGCSLFLESFVELEGIIAISVHRTPQDKVMIKENSLDLERSSHTWLTLVPTNPFITSC